MACFDGRPVGGPNPDGAVVSQQWGVGNARYHDVPIPGDCDGDGTADIAVWRPLTGV